MTVINDAGQSQPGKRVPVSTRYYHQRIDRGPRNMPNADPEPPRVRLIVDGCEITNI